MWPHLVVMPTPIFNDDIGFETIPEPLRQQALIPELAIEALVRPVLPWFARINQGRLNPFFNYQTQQRRIDKLWPIVTAQIARRPATMLQICLAIVL